MLLSLLLVACTRLPDSIPDKPGTITAAELPALMTAASPDVPYFLWQYVDYLGTQGYRDCPTVTTTDTSVILSAKSCTDTDGAKWDGTAVLQEEEDRVILTFSDFSYGYQGTQWAVKGSVIIADGDGAYDLTTRLILTPDGDAPELWVDTAGTFLYNDGIRTYRYSGTVGLESWGLATFVGDGVPLGIPNGCTFAGHNASQITFTGTNKAELSFYTPVEAEGPPLPPALAALTAPSLPAVPSLHGHPLRAHARRADTGFSGGDTGRFDTGLTGTDTGSGDTGDDSAPTGTVDGCGYCAIGSIDGEAASDCVLPSPVLGGF